jgi:hypothetical protein
MTEQQTAKDFRIFGLNSDATLDDLKRRYRKLCLLYHPDKEDGSSEKFIELTEAYQRLQQVLKSDTKSKETPSSFEQLYETLFDALQRYIVSLLKEGVSSKKTVVKPKTIVITIRPQSEDIYQGQVTKVLVKVLRQEPERRLVSIPLYISFIPFKRSYLFLGLGDEVDGVRGDIEVLVETPTDFVITNEHEVHCQVLIEAEEFLYGFEKRISVVNGVEVLIQRKSFLIDPTMEQRFPNMGLLLDDEGNRGDLVIEFKLIPLSEEEGERILENSNFCRHL